MDITDGITFKTRIAGVTHSNRDGTKRQALIARCKAGESLTLRREPENPYDEGAIAVHRSTGEQLGYMPGGDTRLASWMDSGGEVSARIVNIDGGLPLLLRLLGQRRNYGCVIEVTKS
jgi:single-stranded-DNA-specific exonuclease